MEQNPKMEDHRRTSPKTEPTNPSDRPQVETYTNLDEALNAQDAGVEVDDMELRRLALKGQGHLESEFCFGDESSLHKAFQNCDKNPGHEGFIPMDELRLDNLPEDIRQPSILKLIQCQGVLTVKLKTFYTSANRPRPEPRQARGLGFGQRATGFVLWAKPIMFVLDGERHPFEESPSKMSPEDTGYVLRIFTAAHVVFDQSEANEIEVEFSYSNDDTGEKIVKTLMGPANHTAIGGDLSELIFFTHDKDLYTKLRSNLDEMNKLELMRGRCRWLIIVSHPHYQEKHVSFGKFENSFDLIGVDPDVVDLGYAPIRYSTPTCPGSSGARISLPLRRVHHEVFAHSGIYSDKFNISSPGYYKHNLELWSDHHIDLEPAMTLPKGVFDWRSDTIHMLKSGAFLHSKPTTHRLKPKTVIRNETEEGHSLTENRSKQNGCL